MRVWHTLTIYVDFGKVEAYLDGSSLMKTEQIFILQSVKVGALVWYARQMTARFKEFHVEEYFAPIASFPNTDDFRVPLIQGISDSHEVKSVLGDQISSAQTYTVSADFQFTVGAFGLCYNIVNDSNFDFVYYR